MRRTFLINLALVLVLNLLVKPFYILGIDAEVQVRVGTGAYGTYYALLSLSFLLNMLLDLGITNWNTRHIAANTSEMREHVSGILPLRALLALLYGLVILIVGVALGYTRHELMLLGILALNQVLAAAVLYLRSNVAGAQRFWQDSLLSVMDRVLLIGMAGYVLWVRNGGGGAIPVEWFAWMQTIAYGCTALMAGWLVALAGGAAWPRFDLVFARSVLKESFPYALLVLLMSFYYRTDTVMLDRLLPDGPVQAGIYAQGFRFFEAFNMLGFLLAGLLLPMFSRMLATREDVTPLAKLATRLVLTGTIAVAVMGSIYAREVMALRYHEHLEGSAPAFAVLIWSFVAVCLTYVHGTLLTASGDLRTLNWLAACGMVLNLTLNLVLIPRYQALGAAWAGFITQALMALAQIVLTGRRFGAAMPVLDVFRALIYGLMLAGITWGTRAAGLSLPMAFGTVAITALVAAFLTGLFDLEQVRRLLAARPVR